MNPTHDPASYYNFDYGPGLHGRCLEVRHRLPSLSVDAVFDQPPPEDEPAGAGSNASRAAPVEL